MTEEQISKITAEMCGVFFGSLNVYDSYWTKGSIRIEEKWTINDARCREVVREFLEVETVNKKFANGLWMAKGYSLAYEGLTKGEGKTIAEAEIACITAICESNKRITNDRA